MHGDLLTGEVGQDQDMKKPKKLQKAKLYQAQKEKVVKMEKLLKTEVKRKLKVDLMELEAEILLLCGGNELPP
jgi:hypothetical protein